MTKKELIIAIIIIITILITSETIFFKERDKNIEGYRNILKEYCKKNGKTKLEEGILRNKLKETSVIRNPIEVMIKEIEKEEIENCKE